MQEYWYQEEEEFFEKRKLPDNITSFYAQLDQTTYTYDFGNLSTMINHYKEKNDGKVKNLNYVLVPIDVEISTINNQPQITAVYNQMSPTGTTLFYIINQSISDKSLFLSFSTTSASEPESMPLPD